MTIQTIFKQHMKEDRIKSLEDMSVEFDHAIDGFLLYVSEKTNQEIQSKSILILRKIIEIKNNHCI